MGNMSKLVDLHIQMLQFIRGERQRPMHVLSLQEMVSNTGYLITGGGGGGGATKWENYGSENLCTPRKTG